MKDSAKLLNFNVNRELKFSVFRHVDFTTERSLYFDQNRQLSFNQNRDLGFGKRGVVFRGYVCPSCRAPVARDAPRCDECGIVFEQSVKKERKLKNARAPPERRHTAARAQLPQTSAPGARPPAVSQVRGTFGCPGCGRIIYVGAEQCPGCGTRFISAAPPPSAPFTCPSCRSAIPAGDSFCGICGTPRPPKADSDSWNEFSGTEGG